MPDLPPSEGEPMATASKIQSYLNLPAGWHYGKGGPANSDTVFLAARAEAMLREAGYETDSFPGVDGEILVCGYLDGVCITVEISREESGRG